MSEDMNLSVNEQSRVPPGFRFHPTEEELLHYYLRKKVASEKIDLDVIQDVDLNKLEPWDIQDRCKIGCTPQNDWYFFSHKDRKYPTGSRTNRATTAGFWKATGRDKVIYSSLRRIGMRKTLVFYKGRAPHGQKSHWIMHEYRLDDTTNDTNANNLGGGLEEGWVVCRVFKKKDYNKALESSQQGLLSTSPIDIRTQLRNISSSNDDDDVLDHILHYMGRSCEQERIHQTNNIDNNILYLPSINPTLVNFQDRFTHLPGLETTPFPSPNFSFNQDYTSFPEQGSGNCVVDGQIRDGLSDWVAMDRLVASHLNSQDETCKDQLSCYVETNHDFCFPDVQLSHTCSNRGSEIDLWSFAPSSPSSTSSDPLGRLSV